MTTNIDSSEAAAVTTIGFLHPGDMGASLAAALKDNDRVTGLWAGQGRSPATAERAADAGLSDVVITEGMTDSADAIVSICPPAAAEAVARSVADTGFDGIYVDANAISPATSTRIGHLFDRYVDGGVIGPPAHRPGTTRLYLAGAEAAAVASWWSGSNVDARVVADDATDAPASALKMAYAAWTKGTSALLLTVNALARSSGVEQALRTEWELSQPGLVERTERSAPQVAAKAWRWVGEMEEIADTMGDADLPDGFHRAAAELYERLAAFKSEPDPSSDAVIDRVSKTS